MGEAAGSNPVGPTSSKSSKETIQGGFPDNAGAAFLQHEIEKSQFKEQSSALTSAKVRHAEHGFFSVAEVAKRLSVNVSTVTRWCKSGKLPAIPKAYGNKTTWQISPQAIEMFLASQKQEEAEKQKLRASNKSLGEMLPKWESAMEKGTLTGKPFSKFTRAYYAYYVKGFIVKYSALTVDAVKSELIKCPAHQFGRKEKYYKALVCFAKFLVREGALDVGFLEQVKPLYPKRHLPPKRLTVTEDKLQALIDSCKSPLDRCLVVLLSQTGLRASEACALKWEDIDTEQGVLIVRLGKGNKTRRVGLSVIVLAALQKHLEAMGGIPKSGFLFLNSLGNPMTRDGLYQRIERVGKKAGVSVSPHALRRAFVTINASKGRPLPMLQRACGHNDLKTTMSYCQIAENEVIEAMKGWD